MYEIFDKKCSKKLDHLNIDAVYAYEGSALETFKVAKKNKIKCFYEIPLHYWVYKKNILNKFSKKKLLKNIRIILNMMTQLNLTKESIKKLILQIILLSPVRQLKKV